MNRDEPSTSQHNTVQHSMHITTQHSPAQHPTAQLSTAQHSTAQHSTTHHSTARLTIYIYAHIYLYICSLLPIASAPCLFAQVCRCVASHINIAEFSQLSCNDGCARRSTCDSQAPLPSLESDRPHGLRHRRGID